MSQFFHELKISLRKHRKALLSSLTTALVLGVAAGANAAIYTLADSFFLGARFSPATEVYLIGASPRDTSRDYFYMFHPALLDPVQESLTSFETVARISDYSLTLGNIDRPLRLSGLRLGAGSQEVLQIETVRGRPLRRFDFEPGAEKTLLLGHHVWIGAFGGDDDVIGRSVTVNGTPHRIVGVMQSDFSLRRQVYDVATPSTFKEERFFGANWPHCWLAGRLKEGKAEAQAIAEVKSFETRLEDLVPAQYYEENALNAKKQNERAHSLVKGQLNLLIASGSILFVIAAVNLCSFSLVQLNRRRGEYAMRVALGASRWDIIRLFAIENAGMILLGYSFAVLFGYGLIRIVLTQFEGADWGLLAILDGDIELNWRVLTMTLGACLVVLVLISLTTLALSSARLLATFLKEEGRGGTGSKAFKAASHSLRFIQISATSVALVVGAFFVVSLARVSNYDYGYSFDRLVQAEVRLPYFRFSRPEVFDELTTMINSVVQASRQVPGISSASVSKLRFPHWGNLRGIRLADTPAELEDRHLPQAKEGFVSPGFFDLVGMRQLRGEAISDFHKRGDEDRVIVVNEAFVGQFFKGASPLDQVVGVRGQRHRVIGVVNNLHRWKRESGARHGLPIDDQSEPAYYLPHAYDNRVSWAYLYLKASDWNVELEQRVRESIQRVDAEIVVGAFGDLRRMLERNESTFSLIVSVQVLLAGIGVLLACVAIYAAISNSVAQRRRETGIRLALGATPGRIRDSILLSTAFLVAPAVLVGCALAYICLVHLGFLENQLFLVELDDPSIYLFSGAALLIFGILASVWPALAAASASPTEILREA